MMRIYELETLAPEEILNRDIRAEADVDAAVDAILEDVRLHGDGALRRYTRGRDGAELGSWQVSGAELDAAWAALDADFAGGGARDNGAHQRDPNAEPRPPKPVEPPRWPASRERSAPGRDSGDTEDLP